jgi:hypothetical protein
MELPLCDRGLARRSLTEKMGALRRFFVLGSSLVPRGLGAWFFVLRKYGMHRSVARQAVGGAANFLSIKADEPKIRLHLPLRSG